MIKYIFSSICSLCLASFAFAQSIDWEGSVSLAGLSSSEVSNPFWLNMNTDRRYGSETHFSGLASVELSYALSENASLIAGTTFFYRDGVMDEFQRRDLFIQYKNKWLKVTAGSKRSETVAGGLSATNKNFLYSGNARPLAGLHIEANDPVKISETFSLDWGIAHYQLNDERYVDNVRVHYKRLALLVQFNENNKVRAQIQHFAQWAGTSPTFGELPNDFAAFVDVFFAKQAPEINQEGEILNAVGNHLGSYLLDYSFITTAGDFSVYHEHPFEDGSGTRLANFPDGVWGIYLQPSNKKIFTGILYEYIDTNDQSASNVSGVDNYFRNNIYRSGWSYEGAIIGMPFILIDDSIVINDDNSPVISNRAQLHHFGLAGSISQFNWQLRSTFVTHSGSYATPFSPAIDLWHNYFTVSRATEKWGTFRVFFGLDSGASIDTNFGAGASHTFTF